MQGLRIFGRAVRALWIRWGVLLCLALPISLLSALVMLPALESLSPFTTPQPALLLGGPVLSLVLHMILVLLTLVECTAHLLIWNAAHLAVPTTHVGRFEVTIPTQWSPTWWRVYHIGSAVTSTLIFLVQLDVLTGFYRAFATRQAG